MSHTATAGLSLEQMLDLRPTRTLTVQLLKPLLRQILTFNSEICFYVLTILKFSQCLKTSSYNNPHQSRRIPRTGRRPIITDFGEARFADENNRGQDVMPDVYRAPEVVLRMDWNNKVDIWSIAMVFWDLVAGRTLFQATNDEKLLDDTLHLAEMIAIMGPPPTEFLKRSEVSSIWWDGNGQQACGKYRRRKQNGSYKLSPKDLALVA
ncbi:hypothetical protein AJ79_10117 [Helicocarpus griseus UAMH5409]|uniref:Protein kinase domain-containing protein n=1 Tax=Helicocarpus griseus UAMH5409 TaxID=1447875 RepID=A0A2B7WFM1_9EURO|nr:hypothetical protein AJ79_10117 [Helicocarpus griseus UAMH5409]